MISLLDSKILLVDDCPDVTKTFQRYARKKNIPLDIAVNGSQCIEKAIQNKPDIIILDINLPDIDGREVFRRLKKNYETSKIPVIFFSGFLTGEADIVDNVKTGAEDYITKPILPEEFFDRIKSRLEKMADPDTSKTQITFGDLRIDTSRRKVLIKDSEIQGITKTEFDVLCFLIRNSGRVVEKAELRRGILGFDDEATTHSYRNHIQSLRQKLASSDRITIVTIDGIGYRIEQKPASV